MGSSQLLRAPGELLLGRDPGAAKTGAGDCQGQPKAGTPLLGSSILFSLGV